MRLSIRSGRWVRTNHVVQIPIGEDEYDSRLMPVVFDIFQVAQYAQSWELGDDPQIYTDITFKTGEVMCIDADFTDFDQLFEQYAIKSSTRYYFPN